MADLGHVIGWLLLAAWFGALSVLRFVLVSRYPGSRHRVASLAHAVALASISISCVLVAVRAPNVVVGAFFVAGGLIAFVNLVWMTARGTRPSRIRHAWREIGDPDAWRGHPQSGPTP